MAPCMLICIHNPYGDAVMRSVVALGSALALTVASACATSTTTGSARSSRYGTTQPMPLPERTYVTNIDSVVAQAIANREGPRVSIRAQLSNVSGSRRVRGIFRLEDDAYVVVGHIDADGVLRIAFPNEPTDDGFVHGNRSYQTSEFFAGFNAEYRYRVQSGLYTRVGMTPDAYDGGLGYVFVIASWRPMRFDRFQTGNVWDSFELADDAFMRDPRPAIHELAALLAGDNPEAYTVKFARFSDTQSLYGGYNSLASSYGPSYCSGYDSLGYGSLGFASPFGLYGYQASLSGYGRDFSYRGTNYYYDATGDCYRSGYPSAFGYGYRIVAAPGVNTPGRPRALAVDGGRTPPRPQPLPGHFFPKAGEAAPGNDQTVQHSPEYRQRGLIDDGESTGPVRRSPRVGAPTSGGERTRPSIEDMVNRRGENRNDGSMSTRPRFQPDNTSEPRGYSRPETREMPRSEPSTREQTPPRIQAPDRVSPPSRSEPSPRMQAPERSSPPAARSEPRSEPASRPPEKPATPPPAASSTPSVETPVKPPPK